MKTAIKLASWFLTLAIAVLEIAALSSSSSFVVHEVIESVPRSFTKITSPSLGDQILTLRIQLAQSNMSGLEQELYAVSVPGSPKYGQHLSAKEVASYVAPTEQTSSAVNAWLNANGLDPKIISIAGDWLEISLPVTKANQLLDTEFSTYQDARGNQFIRTLSYSIPSDLAGHIDIVYPTVNFPVNASLPLKKNQEKPSKRRSLVALPSNCGPDSITPICLQDLYGIPTAPANSSSNSLWVTGLLGQWVDDSDVSSFLSEYRPDIPLSVNTTFSVVLINNGTNSDSPFEAGDEAVLDIEYTVGLATGVPVTFLSVGPTDPTSTFQEFLTSLLDEANYLVGLDTPPYVLTTSYGADETGVTAAIANSICNTYMQLGARGTSILFASGDGGVGGNSGDSCDGEPFIPVFPGKHHSSSEPKCLNSINLIATCPYVTSVGATEYISGDSEEVAYFSSGGFSNIFPRPSYQDAAVTPYLSSLGSTYTGLYNTTGRGFPDVSANGLNFVIYYDGEGGLVGSGTSCSSPTFASVVALVNDRLLSAGKSPLGFLNPFLYANPGSLTDITTGFGNLGCGTNGFSPAIGWDPISGLGTPNFTALVSAAGV